VDVRSYPLVGARTGRHKAMDAGLALESKGIYIGPERPTAPLRVPAQEG
jgi:hypothetical protein